MIEVRKVNESANKTKEQYNIEKINNSLIKFQIEEVTRHLDDYDQLINFTQIIRQYKEKIYELKMKLGSDIEKVYSIKNGKVLEQLKERKEWLEGIETKGCITSLIANQEQLKTICKKSESKNEYPISFFLMLLKEYEGQEIQIGNRDGRSHYCLELGKSFYSREKKEIIKEPIIGLTTSNYIYENENLEQIEIKENVFAILGYKKVNKQLLKMITTIACEYEKLSETEERAIQMVNIQKSAEIFKYYEQEIEFWEEINLKKVIENDEEEHYLE